MALVWTKRERQATYDRGRWSGTQSYLVRDDADAAVSVYTIASGAISPVNYQVFGAGDDASMAAYMRFVSATYSPVGDGMDKIWNVVFSFDSTTGDGAAATAIDVKTETEQGFTAIETSITTNIVDIWRSGSSLNILSYGNDPDDADDVAGSPMDTSGEPISNIQTVINISVRNVIYGRPAYATIASIVGKRNSAGYTFGATGNTYICDTGSLVLTGSTTSRIGPNTYEVNYQFSHDPYTFHMRQQALRDKDGNVKHEPATNAAVSSTNISHATHVYWVQPFPLTTAFSTLGIAYT